ncbi:surface-adhesin E family protein [Xylophilus sp. GOD-11R]|uniref:surface-adhesin E family protein n=1 Tax=Xylophilus sp. GOD-11R TaxID=3089814 RepID=UPI00298BFA29|nr:surface-adhesin E family protein [Xylophilus sp. GOD-11R]WPB54965.1 hypothetical protein R9X41_12355 [Xylophilus sp. GOD-11R]
MPVRLPILVASLLLCGSAQAVEWFTVIGDKNDPAVDTAQLDISTVARKNNNLMLRFRVNLAMPRKLGGTEVYQSYVSHITIECATKSVFHEDQIRFRDALWQGPTHSEQFIQPKPMAFGGLYPDPKPKILAAACQSRLKP